MSQNQPEIDFDLIVIGAGSGGLATSKRAAAHGARVAIIESSRVGGTCVIRGCIPKKLMVYASQLGNARELARDYGWNDTLGSIDWQKLKTFRDNVVSNLEAMHERYLEKAGVALIHGNARIDGPGRVEVNGRVLHAERIVIATCARPTIPDITGVEHAISSDGFWGLEEQPKRAIVVGAGYIALELACALQGLGTETHLVVRGKILRTFDQEIADHLETSLKISGLTIHKPALIQSITNTPDGVALHWKQDDGTPRKIEGNQVTLVATGRHPNTSALEVGNADIQLGDSGEILVNEFDETSCKGIYAVGDVTLRPMLTPVAIKAGRALADRLFAKSDALVDYSNVPTAIFSQPPVGSVGISEAEAQQKYPGKVQVYRSEFGGLLFSPTPKERTIRTLTKLIVHAETNKVLGCHMVGPDAAEIIQGFAVAIQAGATKADFDRTIAIHPSSAEEFVLMS